MTASRDLLRTRGHEEARVGMVELFFDLVFVFAVTQLSHALLAQLTVGGAIRVALLLLAIWWVWIYTSWVTNFLDPDRIQVRVCLFLLMLAGLLLSSSIPQAFGERGLVFAAAYVSMQVGRTAFVLWAIRGRPLNFVRNFQRVFAWLLLSSVIWFAGGFASGDQRLAWWALALFVEFISPIVYFWVPGLGRSTTADWTIDGGHLAERCALFVIIALGESLLVTGATFATLEWDAPAVAAFLVALIGSIAMWWVYFDTGAERASYRIKHSTDPGAQARTAYTYLHLLIVGGVIVGAVGDELLLAHPHHLEGAGAAAIIGGPALYLVGNALFKWVTNDRRAPPLSHMAGLLMLALLPVLLAYHVSALSLGALVTAVLVIVAVWESLALRRPPVARRTRAA